MAAARKDRPGRPDGNDDWCEIDVAPGMKARIDREDLERVSEYRWRATRSTTGRLRVVTCIRGEKGPRNITLGKFLMNPPEGKLVYPRRFNDGLDYRKGNLIICTMAERQRILPKRRVETSSVYRGVSYSQPDDKWKAAIKVEGETIPLGLHGTEDEAAHAYNKAAEKYFGPKAYQNPIGRNFRRRRGDRK